jgi:hypothetical protein
MNAVRTVNLLLAAMMTGGLVMVMVAVIPTFHRLPAPLAVHLHREVDRFIDVPLPIFTVLTVLTAIPLLFDDNLSHAGKILVAVAMGAAVVVAVSSHLINRPMNQRLRQWDTEAVPDEYGPLRRRWDLAHAWRTFAGVASLVCLITSMLNG